MNDETFKLYVALLIMLVVLCLMGCSTTPKPEPLPVDSTELWGWGFIDYNGFNHPPKVFNMDSNTCWIVVNIFNQTNQWDAFGYPQREEENE
jgi:hypothetical protein